MSNTKYKIGDVVTMDVPRAATAIWLDRLRQMRWNVPTKEAVAFKCVDTSPGALWPGEPA